MKFVFVCQKNMENKIKFLIFFFNSSIVMRRKPLIAINIILSYNIIIMREKKTRKKDSARTHWIIKCAKIKKSKMRKKSAGKIHFE